MIVKIVLGASLVVGLLGGILFLAAGRLDWAAAWIAIGLYTAFLLFMLAWGAAHAPDLMRERGRLAGNVKSWDKLINLGYTLALIGLLLTAGLDARYGWSGMPPVLKWLGGTGMIASSYVIWLTMKENAYLSRWARIQQDRGQTVVSSGPYRFVRHPMYAAILGFVLSLTLLLGSAWALIPAGIVTALYVLRTALEDRMLREELAGYREYARQVRFRLIPGLW